jgi:manganese/zinc/iron transport system permease protein
MRRFALILAILFAACGVANAAAPSQQTSIADTSIHVPTAAELARVLFLRDYNTRVVILGTSLLGLAAGIIGSFMLLRKRALMGDALSHATLPGIGMAFIISSAGGGSGKSLPILLLGATISGVLGVLAVLAIRNYSRLKEDAALGIVLSVFFGAGVAVLGIVQKMNTGSAAGLESFIYGKTASMLASDAQLIGIAAAAVAGVCALLYKEFTLLCFDPAYGKSEGWPIFGLDLAMMALVVAVTVIGLQAVGLILIIALLIIPPAAARFWTDRLLMLVIGAACIGAASGYVGATLSALVPRLPAGAVIVVVASAIFVISMFVGRRRGVLVRVVRETQLKRKIDRQNLLRELFEAAEDRGVDPRAEGVERKFLQRQRAWSPHRLGRVIKRAESDGLIFEAADGTYRATDIGWDEARRTVRNHRLWEAYLINYADIAPSHVDRDADQIEHVIGQPMVARLESLIADRYVAPTIPPSPHLILNKNERKD